MVNSEGYLNLSLTSHEKFAPLNQNNPDHQI